ncbi:MAG: S46 family peptidase, partial [Planctomycetes bacterium]|nr:S46 family peptidase [Planctomycetota bacterium]
IFDGNIQSLILDLAYTEEQARAVAVDSRGIIEAMKKIYDAGPLADEILKK